jgi:hypothetical protein
MTETELTDRLRESIVLDGPDAWRTNGYLQDAQRIGLSEADALKRAKEIGQEVNNNSLLFQNIQARIARMSQPSRHHMREQDLQQIMNAATSLNLSPDFVRNRWVPTVLERLAPPPTPKEPEPVVTVSPPVAVDEPTKPDTFEDLLASQPEPPKPEHVFEPPTPVVELIPPQRHEPIVPTPPPVIEERPVTEPRSNYVEPLPIVRNFTATPAKIYKGQSVTLAWEVENLLAVTIDDLGEGLSPKNHGWVKPSKTTDYTLFDANNNPLSTVRIEVLRRDRSGVYGVLFALALLALIYWFIKSTNSAERAPEPKRKAEHTTGASYQSPSRKKTRISDPDPVAENPVTETTAPTETPGESTSVSSETPKKENKATEQPADEATASNEPEAKPASPADARQGKYEEAFGDKPYDKVELGADEQGWRRARTNGRWGYVNDADEWVIKPEYEAVTPFRGNTAAVFQNGKLMTINRSGEQVRN